MAGQAETLAELARVRKAVGMKQSRKAVRDRRARRVFLACDADPALTEPFAAVCEAAQIPLIRGYTMDQLGEACEIAVGASAVAVL